MIKIKKVTIPGTNLETSNVGYGTSRIHHIFGETKRKKILCFALENGIAHFDTSPMYGDGVAERSLGNAFRYVDRESFTIATKVGVLADPILAKLPKTRFFIKILNRLFLKLKMRPIVNNNRTYSISKLKGSLNSSLERLNTSFVDILYLHDPCDTFKRSDEIVDWLLSLKSSGVARNLGLSGTAENCVSWFKAYPDTFDIIQFEDTGNNKVAFELVSSVCPIQITFGFLRNWKQNNKGLKLTSELAESLLRDAVVRNPTGAVLISTADLKHIAELITERER